MCSYLVEGRARLFNREGQLQPPQLDMPLESESQISPERCPIILQLEGGDARIGEELVHKQTNKQTYTLWHGSSQVVSG